MMTLTLSPTPSFPHSSSPSTKFITSTQIHNSLRFFPCRNKAQIINFRDHYTKIIKKRKPNFICRAETEYKFPDPIPEFADAETEKFRSYLVKKLSKKTMFGDSLNEVVEICTKIFSDFLHTEYGGPGTLLVMRFIDMADTINERGLPGGPQAARAAVKWAQKHVDKDWKEWTSTTT